MEVIWNYLGVVDNSSHKIGTNCPRGFQDYSRRSRYCYMLISQHAATWENANQFCNLKHGTLIMPKNKQQSAMIKNMIHKEKRGIAFWIGLRKRRAHLIRKSPLDYNKWAWDDGKFLTQESWKDWDHHRPHKQDCVMLTQTRGLNR